MTPFRQAFTEQVLKVFGHEGGFQKNPKDPGNWVNGKLVGTKYGISARSYPHLDIPNLTQEEAEQIYWIDFWLKMGCNHMPDWISPFVFDYGINSGATTVARYVQQSVGVLPDGIIGPRTIAAIEKADKLQLLRLLFVRRARTFAEAAPENYHEHKNGWFARLFDKTYDALTLLK
jgi:lysozyme family protein